MSNLKEIIEKAQAYDAVMESLKNQPIQTYKDENIHFKGYMFDSLVYRYKLAREKALILDLEACRRTHHGSEETLRHNADRDVMRFIEILNEAIGEHD